MKKRLLAFLICGLFVFLSAHLAAQDAVLSGTVVTPRKVISKGWVVIRRGRIVLVSDKRPAGSLPVVETNGIIFPGFIDLHNHPMYDVFPRWKAQRAFKNRYEWRELEEYKKVLGDPGSDMQKKGDGTFCDIDEYSEVKALIGGTTSLTGTSWHGSTGAPPACLAGLVRNLDWASGLHGTRVGHERIKNALGVTPHDMEESDAAALRKDLATQSLDLLLVHVGEGSPKDLESSIEFFALKGRGLLGAHTGVIHGTALTEDNFRQMRASGTALIWSPRSNIELYGVTTNVVAALKEKVTVALAPDWSPTGSTNSLAELAYASRYSGEHLSGGLTDEQLFAMSTAIPAKIARIAEEVGTIEVGRRADLFVLRGNSAEPFRSLANAKPQDVQLVMIGGKPMYGSEALLAGFHVESEGIEVCGERMALNSAALPAGPLAEVQRRLESDLDQYGVQLAPVAECGQ